MPRLIAFLRAINVGGRIIAMADLRRHFEALGCKEVETFIASGNVIFVWCGTKFVTLPKRIEEQLRHSLGYEVKAFIRTPLEIAAVAQHRPFEQSQVDSALTFSVGFLSEPLSAVAVKSVMALKNEIDDFSVLGREVYWLCQRVQSASRFSNARFEKLVQASASWRGMNTIVRLAAKYSSSL